MASILSAKHFHDEAAAFAYLEAQVWPDGPVCRQCGGEGYPLKGVKDKKGRERHGLKKCRACRAQFTVRVKTVFESSHVPLHIWLQAVALMSASKKGVSANQLHRTLGVTLKTAWFLAHRIRVAMAPGGNLPPLGDEGRIVEVDETYHGKVANPESTTVEGRAFKPKRGGKRAPKGGRGPSNKRPIVVLVERGGSSRTFHVAVANAERVARIVRENVDRRSRLHTDGSSLYKKVGKEFASHETVEHSMDECVRGDVHVNSAEGFFSVFKRGTRGVYQHCQE